jgi:hypothetical protein
MSEQTQYSVILAGGQRFGPADLDTIAQWAREGRVPREAVLQSADPGAPPRSVLAVPMLAAIIDAPPTVAGPVVPPDDGAISTLIPYKNGPALAAYYLGVVALIPFLGLLAAPFAIGFGIVGIRAYYRDPRRKGIVHAWTGIALGLVSFVIVGLILLAVIPNLR